jgi:hypothetical protein
MYSTAWWLVHNPEGNYLKLTSYIDGDYIYGKGK